MLGWNSSSFVIEKHLKPSLYKGFRLNLVWIYSNIGNRESGIGNRNPPLTPPRRGTGIGNRESGIGNRAG
ncbi:hypothetical protein BJP36_43270 [Moorena producens JHB]|uniref:Uncharacterized protein n=1 Tax=Moorena producens (strain JHB) TaxID=1454205 RepID=A0A9Q9UVU2_MOOP1|nr:hypothetical protein [Moorena producens]WAN69184.1 hypothetical protein BJP36_43270 [Moorena producens JHB]